MRDLVLRYEARDNALRASSYISKWPLARKTRRQAHTTPVTECPTLHVCGGKKLANCFVIELFYIEEMRCYFKMTMGRGRKGPIEQSQMKPKTKNNNERGIGNWMRFITSRDDEKY